MFRIYFQEVEKLLPMEGLLEILEQNGVHCPGNQFQLVRMKYLLKDKSILGGEKALLTRSIRKTEKKLVSTSQKFGFHQTTRSICFRNTFSPDREIKLTVEGVYENERKNGFH